MENAEEILHSLEEFSKMKPKDIPRELEEYLCFVAKTGDPVYQWSAIKSLFREKLISVVQEFYESCPMMDIPPCPNVDMFNYDLMKNFILERLETFTAAPFTLQRICELLTTPRKEYNRIDKFMRALEKNILVVSTTEPGRKGTENGEGIMNGIESEHVPEPGNEINIEEMDDSSTWSQAITTNHVSFEGRIEEQTIDMQGSPNSDAFDSLKASSEPVTANQESVISCTLDEDQYVSIEAVTEEIHSQTTLDKNEVDLSVTITAVNVKTNIVEHIDTQETSPALKKVAETIPILNEEAKPSLNEPKCADDDVSKEIPSIQSETSSEQLPEQEEPPPSPSEAGGIENISPETSTSSPETLKDQAVSPESKPEELKQNKPSDFHEEKLENISESTECGQLPSLTEAGDSIMKENEKKGLVDAVVTAVDDKNKDAEKIDNFKNSDEDKKENNEADKSKEQLENNSKDEIQDEENKVETPMEVDPADAKLDEGAPLKEREANSEPPV
ncbi:serine/threonine-protein phosphatase 4 regulatory subunit 2-like [Cylas formicarius]|uniref:serine/threonine-protein phosphatase 4 regulatory subunit 2-like n=1 Tax=Cylas formicarius TaxID=197179 RepID=UPI0029583DAD|nr:serine/threonine-protein phosphatase 4 regulatory subunit 2-like [Cylas formicarius]XP_060530550.1 serine/threonine-protein phosphatase 4 regulatory subunit 2-like [Cylas formicarius]